MKTTKIKLERSSLICLVIWLKLQPLQGMKSRSRTRFLYALQPFLEEFDSFRMKWVEKYAERDEKTKEIVIVEDGNTGKQEYEFTPENRKKFEDEIAVYVNEVVEVEFPDKLREDYVFVKNLVLNTNAEFSGKKAEEYDKWASSFQNDTP